MELNGKARTKSCYLSIFGTYDTSTYTQEDRVHVDPTKDMEPIPIDEYYGLRPGNQKMHSDAHCIFSDCSVQFEFSTESVCCISQAQ